MGRSLKEALLGQYAALQEAGLAPTEVPPEEESPLVVVESAPRGRATRPRRESVDRYLEADDLDPNGQFDRDRLPRSALALPVTRRPAPLTRAKLHDPGEEQGNGLDEVVEEVQVRPGDRKTTEEQST